MTNREYFELWEKFRAEMFRCRPDEDGNCPCDYGASCDKCRTDEAVELFKQWKEIELPKDKKYRVTITDTVTYEFDEPISRERAVSLARDWFIEREPYIHVEEMR